ncbi:MAG: hypothetical protein ACJAZT_000845 [Gammaproteobacteria bacterium]|jgi:hypothetical protein
MLINMSRNIKKFATGLTVTIGLMALDDYDRDSGFLVDLEQIKFNYITESEKMTQV